MQNNSLSCSRKETDKKEKLPRETVANLFPFFPSSLSSISVYLSISSFFFPLFLIEKTENLRKEERKEFSRESLHESLKLSSYPSECEATQFSAFPSFLRYGMQKTGIAGNQRCGLSTEFRLADDRNFKVSFRQTGFS